MNLVQYSLDRNDVNWIRSNFRLLDFRTRRLLQFEPTGQQRAFISSNDPFKFVYNGRRIGMTTAIIVDAIAKACRTPNTESLIVLPNNIMASYVLQNIRDIIEMSYIPRSMMTSIERNNVNFNNGSSVRVRFANRRQDLNLSNTKHLYFDQVHSGEFAVWNEIIYEMTLKDNFQVTIAACPIDGGMSQSLFPYPFKTFHFPSTGSMLLSQEELDEMARMMPVERFRLEILAEY